MTGKGRGKRQGNNKLCRAMSVRLSFGWNSHASENNKTAAPSQKRGDSSNPRKTSHGMSAIEDPGFGIYGTWEAANPDCVAKGLGVSDDTKMILLLFVRFPANPACHDEVLYANADGCTCCMITTGEHLHVPSVIHGIQSTARGMGGSLSSVRRSLSLWSGRVWKRTDADSRWQVLLPIHVHPWCGLIGANLVYGSFRMVPIARFCSWLITCPIMLFQVVGIHDVTYFGVSAKNLVMAAALIRT
eukprot:2123337-Rhodomonas_salina.1